MADLKIVADYSDIQVMRRELVGVAKDAKASASVFEREYAKVEKQQKASLNAVKRQLAFSKRMEAQKAREAKVSASAAADVAKEEERLKNKFVEGYTAMNIYTKEMNDLAVARKRGIITTNEQKDAVAQLNVQMKAGTGAFANAATGMQVVGKRANRTGVLAQQAGYQFGDFAVQVQSGTNPMIAFGQQATQLIGTFSMLAKSTKAIVAFSALGVIVPVITAIAGAFMRMKSANDEAAQGAKRLDDRLKALKETLRDYAELQAAMKEGVSLDFKVATKGIEQAKQDLADAEAALERVQLISMGAAGGITFGSSDKLNEAIKEVTENSVAYKAALAEVTAARKTLADLEAKEADESQAQADLRLASLEKLVGAIEQEAKAQGEYYGKTASEQERLNSLRELHNTLLEAGLTPSDHLYLKAVQYHSQMVANTESTAAMTSALEAAAVAQSSLANLGEDYEVQLAMVNAQITALEQGKNAEVAAFIEGERAKATALYEASKAMAVQTDNVVALAEATLTFLEAMDALDALAAARSKLASINRPSSSGGGVGAGQSNEEYLAQQLLEIKQKKTLIGLSQQELAIQKIYNDAQKRGISLNDDRVKELVKEQKELNQLSEESDSYQQMIGGLRENLTNAFESVLNGTKSVAGAFKDMVRQMLMSIAQKNFIKPLVSGLTSGITSAVAGTAAAGTAAGGTAAAGGVMGAASGIASGLGGVLSGGGLGASFANLGGLMSGSVGGLGAIGAAIPAIGLVVAGLGLFIKKTKVLDAGLRATVDGFDVAIETFEKTQASRLFGLLKGKKKTGYDAASAEVADPLVKAVGEIQQSVLDAADTLGIGAGAFDNFSYQFKVSLGGLSEEDQLQKVTQELNKMGDSFASLVPNIGSMAELTAVYQERLNLETRLLQLQGDTQALRKIELDSVNDYNKAILQQIYATEDAAAALNAANAVSNERLNLETRLLELQGDTEALRKLELASVNESNRALQQQIYAHEDAAESMRKLEEALNSLQENDFATMLDFQRARAAIRLGQPVANNLNAPTMPASSGVAAITTPMASTSAEIVQLRTEMKEMHKEAMFAYSKLIKNGKDSRDTLRSWDVVGLPPERTA